MFANPLLRHICLVGGSRSGKTFFIIRAIMTRALRGEGSRHAILRFRANAARQSVWLDTLPSVNSICFPEHRFEEHRQDGYWLGPNGSQIWVGGLDDKERVEKILGNEYCSIFLNECSQISYSSALLVRTRLAQNIPGLVQRMYYDLNPVGKTHWTNKMFGLKLDPESDRPLADSEKYDRLFLNPQQNEENLDPEYFRELKNSPQERHRKRFFEGVYVDEVVGALWSYAQIESIRCDESEVPEFVQTVVAIDPSGASTPSKEADVDVRPKNDEIGIVVASLGKDRRVYLRADFSLVDSPEGWAKKAVAAYHHFGADHIVAEVNYGGGMVEAVIRAQDGAVPVKTVRAGPGQGKHIRAEPVSLLYTRDGVRHVGKFSQLEDQLCDFTSLGYGGPKSPDRADAWIWAVTDLVLSSGAEGWLEYYRLLSEAAGGAPTKPEFGYEVTPGKSKTVRLRVPEGISQVYGIDGTAYTVGNDRIVTVSEEDAVALTMRGWERVE